MKIEFPNNFSAANEKVTKTKNTAMFSSCLAKNLLKDGGNTI